MCLPQLLSTLGTEALSLTDQLVLVMSLPRVSPFPAIESYGAEDLNSCTQDCVTSALSTEPSPHP